MKVLVTGSHGYIGSVLTEDLRRCGATVVGLDSNLYPERQFLPWEGPDRFFELDIRDVESKHLDGVGAVVHLAALSNDPLGEIDASLTDEINHQASIRLAQLCKEVGVRRFIFSSSCSIYGASQTTDILDEEAPIAPVTAYARSKVDTERDLLALTDEDFTPVFLRNATAYGVSPKMRFDLVLSNLFGWAFTTGRIRIESDGTPWRPLVHVRDICTAIVLALQVPEHVVRGQAFNVGTDQENYQVRDIGLIVQQVLPKAKLIITGETGPDRRSYRVNFQKIRRVLGFRSQWTALRGVQELLEVVECRNLTFEEFSSVLYINVQLLKHRLNRGELHTDLRPRKGVCREKRESR